MDPLSPAPRQWTIPFLSSSKHVAKLNELRVQDSAPWALVILNTPVSRQLVDTAWNFCALRYCADGGANRLYDVLPDSDRECYIPHLIKGDLDSVRPEICAYYSAQGVPVVLDANQDSTDLMKCLATVIEEEKASGAKYNVLILGGLGGRLDQSIHTLSYFHKQRKLRRTMMALTDDSLAWGEHIIHVDRTLLGPTCGLLPVGVAGSRLSTSGLEWNLHDIDSSFDGLVSTSNHVIEDEVWIKNSDPIVWTIAVRKSLGH